MGTIDPFEYRLKDGTVAVIRSGEKSDAVQLIEHLKSILTDGAGMVTEEDELMPGLKEEEAWIESLKNHPHEILLVVEADGGIRGNLDFHVGGRRRLSHRGVLGMAVAPGWRGNGVGEILMQTLLDWVETIPEIHKVSLAVLASNLPAIRLYGKFGFQVEGRRQHEIKMPDGSFEDDILMYRFTRVHQTPRTGLQP